MHHNDTPLIALFAVGKGLSMAVVTLFIVGTTFLQSIVITVVSGLLTGGALIFSAYIAQRATDKRVSKLNDSLDDVKGSLGAAKRRTDRIDERDQNKIDEGRGGS